MMTKCIQQLLAISAKEIKLLLRDSGALFVLFLMPVIFVTIMTYAGVGNQGFRPVKVIIINHDQGDVASAVINNVASDPHIIVVRKDKYGNPYDESTAKVAFMKRWSDIGFITIFPADFSQKLLHIGQNNESTSVNFVVDPATGGEELFPIERLIEKNVMLVSGAISSSRYDYSVLAKSDIQKNILNSIKYSYKHIVTRLEFKQTTVTHTSSSHPLTAKEQNVPGYTIFGIFFIVQIIGNTILREKESGTFDRLMISPISKPILLIGKLIPFYIVNIIQVICLFAFGHFVFGVSMGSSYLGLALVTLATAASANSLGLFIASISKSVEQMGPLSGVIIVVLATIGGILIPFFEMPHFLQSISFLAPQSWALQGFQDVLVRGYSACAVLPCVGALLIFTAIFYLLALLKFRFN